QGLGITGDLFDSLLVFENYPVSKVITSRSWALKIAGVELNEQGNFLLGITIAVGSTVMIRFSYNTRLLPGNYVQQIRGHFYQVLGQLTDGSPGLIRDIELLTKPEYQQLLKEFNVINKETRKEKTVVDLFHEQVQRNPEAIALVFGNEVLTYRELDNRSNQLGNYLQNAGVRSETIVAICLDRSLEMIIGIWGIMKAGGAYVPIDPGFPAERIGYILKDSGAEILVCSSINRSGILLDHEMFVVELDDDMGLHGKMEPNPVSILPGPDDLAYVIYTSGSTGRPKGVMIEHRCLANYLVNSKTKYINPEHPEFLVKAGSFIHLSYTFDASLTGIFLPLVEGKSIVIGRGDPMEVFNDETFLKYAPYDFLKVTPSHIPLLELALGNRTGESLTKKLVIGGEALQRNQVVNWMGGGTEIVNEYGPTEATVGCSVYWFKELEEVGPGSNNSIPIGKPIDNIHLYIVDAQTRLVPVGVTGELCIGGTGLARGYLNRPDLTAERFITHLFQDYKDSIDNESIRGYTDRSRLYKTGDLCRWLPDDNIEYLGRIDEQVKIRGYRVEPGEIERVLDESGLVKQCAIIVRKDAYGKSGLVGYVVPRNGMKPEDISSIQGEILTFLKNHLPEYMLPSGLMILEQMPLTPNGKTDRKTLQRMESGDGACRKENTSAVNAIEVELVKIWQDLLQIKNVGTKDDFFELGGHSLLAIRLIAAIRKQLGVEVLIGEIFDYPTISTLAGKLEGHTGLTTFTAFIKQSRPDRIPLSFAQERLWFIDQLEGSLQYHIPLVLRIKGTLQEEALIYAFQQIVVRHEVLRTMIEEQDGKAFQRVQEMVEFMPAFVDDPMYKHNAGALQSYIEGLIEIPFDLASDFKLRVHLIRLFPREWILVMVLHHIASDGWSAGILVKELVELYDAYMEKREVRLPVLPLQYADYAIWQRKYLSGNLLMLKTNYWQKQLMGMAALNLPTDYPRPGIQRMRGDILPFRLGRELSGELLHISRQEGVTLFMTLLAAFKVLLYRYSGQGDITIGSVIAGRQQSEVGGLIGFFINTLVFRTELGDNPDFITLLQRVKQTTLAAYENQEVPFEKVVEAVVKERDMSRNPLFDVLFVMQNNSETVPEHPKLPGLELVAENINHHTSKFDLTYTLAEGPEGLEGSVEYCSDLYKEDTIARMLDHYKGLLHSISKQPGLPIASLPMLTFAERYQVLEDFNPTRADYPTDQTIVDLFEERALIVPDAVALVFEEECLTFRELDERSNQLSHYLRKKGVGHEDLVAICLGRSIEMVVGILGILKTGAAYVPIDPNYPLDRIRYMLQDTGSEILISSGDCAARLHLGEIHRATVIDLDRACQEIAEGSTQPLPRIFGPADLAYVIYTSGSTGQPKGVMIEHKNLFAFIQWCRQEFSQSYFEIMYAVTSLCFDLSVFELFYPLVEGKPVRILENGLSILACLSKDSSVFVNSVPDVVRFLVKEKADFKRISVINMAGEPIPPEVQHALDTKRIEVRNLYGPTEATTYSTCYRVQTSEPVLIGKPIANTRIYITGPFRELCPIGIQGELYIGGSGVSRGYLNRPELTAERFISDP
ncbi:amino acid adenylation domain-containing protein, partial [Flavitalea flava]